MKLNKLLKVLDCDEHVEIHSKNKTVLVDGNVVSVYDWLYFNTPNLLKYKVVNVVIWEYQSGRSVLRIYIEVK